MKPTGHAQSIQHQLHTPPAHSGPGAVRIDGRHRRDAKGWADSGDWVRVKSSNVSRIRYDKDAHDLYVEFHGGAAHYVYSGVPRSTAEAMFNADSMGRFVHTRLKGKFSYTKQSS